MKQSVDFLADLFERGLIRDTPDFTAEKQPDGRNIVRLARKLKPGAATSGLTEVITYDNAGTPATITALVDGAWAAI